MKILLDKKHCPVDSGIRSENAYMCCSEDKHCVLLFNLDGLSASSVVSVVDWFHLNV